LPIMLTISLTVFRLTTAIEAGNRKVSIRRCRSPCVYEISRLIREQGARQSD